VDHNSSGVAPLIADRHLRTIVECPATVGYSARGPVEPLHRRFGLTFEDAASVFSETTPSRSVRSERDRCDGF
jgi:hypothetical protein